MNNFGKLKVKILEKLTESYKNKNKTEIKEIVNLIKKDKNFREIYLFYENFEKMYFDNKEDANSYLDKVSDLFKSKINLISELSTNLNKKIGDVKTPNNKLYESLDLLLEEDNLSNIDKKIKARKYLVEHLMTDKLDVVEEEETPIIANQQLLYAVLANNFNAIYDNSLTEEEKEELKGILTIPANELETQITELKEAILAKTDKLLAEDVNSELAQKLLDVKNEVECMTPTRFSLYRLKGLKETLD